MNELSVGGLGAATEKLCPFPSRFTVDSHYWTLWRWATMTNSEGNQRGNGIQNTVGAPAACGAEKTHCWLELQMTSQQWGGLTGVE